MAISGNSYGTTTDVAAQSRVCADPALGVYTSATNPSLGQVESFIDQISAIFNTYLADMGFSIPITQADAKLSIGSMVNEICADLCQKSNGAGRFFTTKSLESSSSAMYQIRKEIRDWVKESANGLEALGASRSTTGETLSMTGGVISLNFADHNEAIYDG